MAANNNVTLLGRMTRDAEVYQSTGEKSMTVARFSLAVDRHTKEGDTDFIKCVAFGRNAEFINKYFRKGQRVLIQGHIQTGSYTNKEGAKIPTTEIVVEGQEFADSKNDGGNAKSTAANETSSEGFMPIPDGVDDELPFA